MTTLQDMTIKDGVLQSNYQFFDPWLIPAKDYEYWMNMQFSGRSPSQVIDDFNNTVTNKQPLKPIQVQNALIAFSRSPKELTAKQRNGFLDNFAATIGWGTILGAKTKTMVAVGTMVNLIDGMSGGEGDNDIFIMTIMAIMVAVDSWNEMFKKMLENNALYSKHKEEIKQMIPLVKDRYIKPIYTSVEPASRNIPTPKPYFVA